MKLTIEANSYIASEILARHIRREFTVTEEFTSADSIEADASVYTRRLEVDVLGEQSDNGDIYDTLGPLIAGIRQEVEADCTARAERLAHLAHGWKRAAKKYRAKVAALMWVPE